MAGLPDCDSENHCIADDICITGCGNGYSPLFGMCNPDPDCFAPNCFDNELCQESSICIEDCGDGVDSILGGCDIAPACERHISLSLLFTIITVTIPVLGFIFIGYNYLNNAKYKKQQKLNETKEFVAKDIVVDRSL